MPEIIELCTLSWSSRGQVQTIRILDDETVFDHLATGDLPDSFFELPVQMKSDAIRFALLAKYGGIWLDASTLASGPIFPWLTEGLSVRDFFLFSNSPLGQGGRLFEIGVIASAPDFPFMVQWSRSFNDFFSRKRIHRAHSPAGPAPWWAKKTFAAMNVWLRKTPWRSALWARKPLMWLPFYPYFISYYLANDLLSRVPFQKLLSTTPKVSAQDYLRLRSEANKGKILEALATLAEGPVPLHDLEFRFEFSPKELEALRLFVTGREG
jgi:hypothetical protein